MRNDKVFFRYLPMAVAHDVEIQGSGAPPLGSPTAFLLLDGLAGLEESSGLQSCLEQDHLVEIGRLLHPGERGCFLYRGSGEKGGFGKRGERFTGRAEVGVAVTQIAAQGNIDSLTR
jgi:hypothetical protein